MLSIFPGLLSYSQIGVLILRLALAVVVLSSIVLTNLKDGGGFEKTKEIIKILGGALILVGMFTQVAALAIALLILIDVILSGMKKIPLEEKKLKLMIFASAMALILLGPGLLSIDLPL